MKFNQASKKGVLTGMRYLLIAIVIFGGFISCEDEDKTREQEAQELEALLNNIQSMASSVPCENAEDWAFAPYGHKACGGPVAYIAYSYQIDENEFLAMVEEYTTKQQAFNVKWEVGSDCAFISEPSEVVCEDGNAVLVY